MAVPKTVPALGPAGRVQAATQSASRLQDVVIGVVLALATVMLLVATEPQIGLTWDEPVYTVAQEFYTAWFHQLGDAPAIAMSEDGIRARWDVNHEHPPLDKVWSGLILHLARDRMGELAAHRLGNMLLVGLLIGLLYLMIARSYGRLAGLLAALALLSMPRFFFHAHLAALDVPGAFAFFAVVSLFWHTRNVRGVFLSIGLGLLLGVMWGAALATKINAAFVLPVLGLWFLIADRRWGHMIRLGIMTAVGPLVFIGLWPWLYYDTAKRLETYIRFITVDHWQIDQWYFGASYMPPPWHFPFVMAVLVIPLTLLVLMVIGVLRGWRDPRPGAPAVMLALGAIIPLLALATGESMVYDNERLFMPSFPFIAALAALGMDWLIGLARTRLHKPLGRALVAGGLVAGALAPQSIQAVQLYPHLLSYYSETVGGLPGAVRLGFENTYWCETYAEALDYINANAREGAVVWAEDWSHDVLVTYQQIGRLRSDLRITRPEGANSAMPGGQERTVEAGIWEADYAIVQFRQSGYTPDSQRFQQENTPSLVVERQGTILMELYERR